MRKKWTDVIKANYQAVFVVIAFLTMVLVSYAYVRGIVTEQMRDLGEETMNTAEAVVSANLSETELMFANIARTVENMVNAGDSNTELLAYLTMLHAYMTGPDAPLPDFMKIYGFFHGAFLDGSGWVPPDTYEPTERPWHIGARENGGVIFFSEPYLDADSGEICISFSKEIFDEDGVSHGVLAFDLDLSRTTNYLKAQTLANNGYGVLLSDTMHFYVHRDDTLIGADMKEAGAGYVKLAQMIGQGEAISAVRFTDADGTDSVAFFRTIFNGWHIGVVTPRMSYFDKVYSMGLVLSVLGLLLMFALSYILIRTQSAKLRSDEESRSKSEFLSRMSHEMRTPLNAIIGMTEIARKTDDPAKIDYSLNQIQGASNHLLGVIGDILDMSKGEIGKLELVESAFAVSELIGQVKNIIEAKAEEKRQHLSIEVADGVPQALLADKQRLSQVMTNLLGNAVKFTQEGGHIGLALRTLGKAQDVYTLEVNVTDDGIGIPKEQQSRLFHAFEQIDGGKSRKFGGTGLGLTISKQIVTLMGGEIGVESEPGKGSRFTFTVQVKAAALEDEAASGGPAVPADAPIFAGKRVLLAEDVALNREILIELLADTGVTVDSAENGREACEKFERSAGAYDLIFMDVHMPEVDGYEATRIIRSMGLANAKTIPIVALTANVFQEDVERCLAVGMNGHLGKPLDIGEVIRTMKRMWEIPEATAK